MTVSIADIDRWDPGDVREVFHATRSRAEAAFEAADGISKLPAFGSWGGDAADAAKNANEQLRKDLDAHGNEALAVAKAAQTAAADMQQVKSNLAQLEADAAGAGFEIDRAGNQVLPGPALQGNMVDLIAAEAKREELQARLAAILAEAIRVDEELARAINMATGAEAIPDTPHTNDPVLQDVLSRPLPEDPQQFHDLWEKLNDEQKDFLYSQNHEIGNHPGMPFHDKDIYNQRHLSELIQTTQTDVGRMQQRYDELARRAYMGDTSAATGNELAALGPQLAAARHDLDGYKAVQTALHPPPPPAGSNPGSSARAPRLLGFIDSNGHAAVSIGNPGTATRTATFVPGTGQDMAAFEGSNNKSLSMFDAAMQADKSLEGKLAVTTWMGYDRPMDLTEAAWPGRAEHGGAALDTFLNGMHASHTGAQAIDTVIGHSYGSTLVGGASTGGNHLAADNVIAVGSPGMLVDHAGDLSIDPGAKVYAMTARNDIIGLATDMTLGADPFTQDFGATRLWAAAGPALPYSGGGLPSVAAHSSYWDPGNPGLANMGAIIAGRPPLQIVTPDGMVPGS
jgi:hypothetical protein